MGGGSSLTVLESILTMFAGGGNSARVRAMVHGRGPRAEARDVQWTKAVVTITDPDQQRFLDLHGPVLGISGTDRAFGMYRLALDYIRSMSTAGVVLLGLMAVFLLIGVFITLHTAAGVFSDMDLTVRVALAVGFAVSVIIAYKFVGL